MNVFYWTALIFMVFLMANLAISELTRRWMRRPHNLGAGELVTLIEYGIISRKQAAAYLQRTVHTGIDYVPDPPAKP